MDGNYVQSCSLMLLFTSVKETNKWSRGGRKPR